ncbi:MAG: uncharacterized membrane protein HdeD (DUF308 family) [Ilumatobacter sp.]|jgi:uncharacterized membrane protein HdeD (DUF308 family)
MPTTERTSPPSGLEFARQWPAVVAVGAITLALGIAVLAWPSQTLTVLSLLLGAQFVIFGVYRLIAAVTDTTTAPGFFGFLGVMMIASGVVVLRNPFETVAVLATLLGVVWIIGGSVDLIGALENRHEDGHWLTLFQALLLLVAGIVVVVWPTPTLAVIAWISGLQLTIFGIAIILTGINLRRHTPS